MSWSNEQISLLINLYKNYPCLYVMKNKDYHNRKLRNSALQKIAEGLKHLRPKTIEAEVQKKFMGLRTTYSSERKKVLESMHGDKEVYTPGLWYYDKMEFLNDQLKTRQSLTELTVASTERENTSNQTEELLFHEEYDIDEKELPSEENEEPYSTIEEKSSSATKYSTIVEATTSTPSTPKPDLNKWKRKRTPDGTLVRALLHNIETKNEDDIFGDFVTSQIKKIKNEKQKSEVQFQIHKILYEALQK